MICRSCLRRLSPRISRTLAKTSPQPIARAFSTSIRVQSAAAAAEAPPADAPTPELKPLTGSADAAAAEKPKLSSCPAGTVLNGLNYFKGKEDPVALPDEEYPEWLWSCLDVQKKADAEDDADAGDEFCAWSLL